MTEQALRAVGLDPPTPPPTDALLEAQKDVLEMIVRGRPLSETLAALCRIVETLTPREVRAAILLVDDATRTLHTGAAPSLPEGYSRAIDGITISPHLGTCSAAAARGHIIITADIASDVRWAGLAHLPLELGLKSAWSLPILSSVGRVLGTFGTYFMEAREPLAQERSLVEVLARTAALAIERQRSDEALAKMTDSLRESEARYRAMNERLIEDDRRKDEFLATLAHELRNPLAPISTGLHILRAGGSPEHTAQVRGMMERQLAHLVRMVDDLLDISRVTLGKVTLKRQCVDFRAVLHSALEATRPLIEASSHELSVRLPKDPLPLDVDPTRLAQVLSNLLNNAAKYTTRGGRIQLTADAQSGQLVVRISDTGVGISEEMLPRVFDLFAQGGRSAEQSQGGLGIGLTLVRRLVEMHGGSIEAESPGIGMGSTFTLRLPLVASAAESGDGASQATRTDGAGPLRILVVDDNEDAAESLAMLLGLGGHQTRVAHSGESALSVAKEFQPDVAFIDIGLPGLNGYDVARRLRAEPVAPKSLMLVALTGWGTDEDRRQADAAGFDWHLVKPADFDGITALLTRRSTT